MTTTETLDKPALVQFTGTENYYRHTLNPKVVFTDGVKYLAETGGAYWLLDVIAIAQQHEPKVRGHAFQVCELTVNADHTGKIVCEDGNGNTVHRQDLEFTDFPLPDIEIWFQNNTIFLPSEY